MMVDARSKNNLDQARQLMVLIAEGYRKVQEGWSEVAEYSEQLRRVAQDGERRMLPRGE
jgi:hypothetical protein